ncbi:hypothetical protein [Paucibacter soli]|uniref:hypothetical protein n=1 Tax=Paucibacter soli TaxID=3133433 RepID=UPI0030A48554
MDRFFQSFGQASLALAVSATPLALALLPHVAWALGSTPVRDVDQAANRPFAKTLCVTNSFDPLCASELPAKAGAFVVPAQTAGGEVVKRLVIEYVSGGCAGTGRATFVQIRALPAAALSNPNTGDNFVTADFPMSVAQFAGGVNVNSAQAFAQVARLYFDPGSTVTMSFDMAAAGLQLCHAHLSGYFVVQ